MNIDFSLRRTKITIAKHHALALKAFDPSEYLKRSAALSTLSPVDSLSSGAGQRLSQFLTTLHVLMETIRNAPIDEIVAAPLDSPLRQNCVEIIGDFEWQMELLLHFLRNIYSKRMKIESNSLNYDIEIKNLEREFHMIKIKIGRKEIIEQHEKHMALAEAHRQEMSALRKKFLEENTRSE